MSKNRYRYLFFDLDGTLTDSKEGITKSAQYALAAYGIDEPDLKNLEKFIGPPLHDSFQLFYGFSDAQAEEAVAKFRERYGPIGLYENRVYDGVKEMLDALQHAGFHLAVATSKPETFARDIMGRFALLPYLEEVSGATMDGSREKKAEVIEECMARLGLTADQKEQVLMIGDREHDILGAKEVGIDGAGVRYGYSKENELEEAGAVYVAETPEDLVTWLCK